MLSNYNAVATPATAIANIAPPDVSNVRAMLNGMISDESTNYTVRVHWGTENKGTNNTWANSYELPGLYGLSRSANVSLRVNGLAPGQRYYYTFSASNGGANIWAEPSWQFVTAFGFPPGTLIIVR